MDYQIMGEIAQHVRLALDPAQPVWASNGALMSYSAGVSWELRVPGGLGGAVRRSLAGEGASLSFLTAQQAGQEVLLASSAPGHVIAWDLAESGPVIATRGSFLAAWGPDVDITVSVAQRAGAAFFGGAGLFLQRIAGEGWVLLHGSGDFREQRLAEGQQLLVSTGHLAAFSEQVDYDIQSVGGLRKALFGGEGIFMTRLTGPGRVLLQSLRRTPVASSSAG